MALGSVNEFAASRGVDPTARAVFRRYTRALSKEQARIAADQHISVVELHEGSLSTADNGAQHPAEINPAEFLVSSTQKFLFEPPTLFEQPSGE